MSEPAAPPDPGWLTLAAAAQRLDKNERTVREWLKDGRLPGRKVRVRGTLEWRVWIGADTPEGPDPEPLQEVLLALWQRHEGALVRLGYLQAQVERLPELTEGAAAAAAREQAARVREQALQVKLVEAAARQIRMLRICRAGWAVAAALLLVLLAFVTRAAPRAPAAGPAAAAAAPPSHRAAEAVGQTIPKASDRWAKPGPRKTPPPSSGSRSPRLRVLP
jgi:hypothetical protein